MSPLLELSSSLLRRSSRVNQTLVFSFLRRFSSSAVCGGTIVGATHDGKAASPEPRLAEYLMSRCGFPQDKASKASQYLRGIRYPDQPDSVLKFFKSHGFEDSQINKIVGYNPGCLRINVDKTLAPKFQTLIDLGFTGDDICHLVTSNARVILNCNVQRKVVPRIELWRKLLGSNEQLLKHLRRIRILGYHVEKILPNIALIHEYGISDRSLSTVLKNHPLLIVQEPARLKALLDYVIELGIPRSSRMLVWALRIIQDHKVKGFKAKMQIMISLGWSESEFICAFHKAPCFINISQKVLQRKIEFFVGEL